MRHSKARYCIAVLLVTVSLFSCLSFGVPSFQTSAPGRIISAAETKKTYQPGRYKLNYAMNLRADPAIGSTILNVIPQGTVVTVDRISAEWGHTFHDGMEGWLSLDYSTFEGSTQGSKPIGRYRTNAVLNFRSAPAIADNNILGTIPSGTILTISEVSGSWGKTLFSGKNGWVSLDYCTLHAPEPAAPASETPQPSGSNTAVDWLVIDISSHNAVGNFNWSAMKAAGVMGVIIRIGARGYGSAKTLFDDSSFYQHYTGAKNAGLHVGAYFFSYALNETQAKEEAQMTINILRSCNAKLDMPVFIDIEDYSEVDHVDRQHQQAGKAVCTKVVDTFCNTIKSAGYYPGIYCNKNFAETLLDKSVFANRALWIAQYASSCSYKGSTVHMWQYTGSGKVSGYSGKYLDLNHCYVNFPAIINGTATSAPAPANPATPSTQPPTVPPTTAPPTTVPPTTAEPEQQVIPGKTTHITEPQTSPVQREWATTKMPTCTQDGEESIVVGDTVFAIRSVSAEHGDPINCVMKAESAQMRVGQTFDPGANRDNFYSEANPYYPVKCAEVNADGGCRFQFCPDCCEILQVSYFYKSSCDHEYHAQTDSQATCTNEGTGKTVCSKCGKIGTEYIIPRKEHISGETQHIQATGSIPASSRVLCKTCGKLMYESYDSAVGDADGDGLVTAADARLTLRHAIKLEQIKTEYLTNVDLNGDGSIDASDARLVLRKAINLE